jgi:hypothetical protein
VHAELLMVYILHCLIIGVKPVLLVISFFFVMVVLTSPVRSLRAPVQAQVHPPQGWNYSM